MMKKKTLLLALFCALTMIGFNELNAQKFGHLNSQLILESHPKVQGASSELDTYTQQENKKFEDKAKAFQAKVDKFRQDVGSGILSQVQIAQQEEALGKEQQELAQEEQQVKFRILQKREELLNPILQSVDVIIKEIGKEEGYTMIFDTSVPGTIIYAIESDDITEKVKAKIQATN